MSETSRSGYAKPSRRIMLISLHDWVPLMRKRQKKYERIRFVVGELLHDLGADDDMLQAILDGDLERYTDWYVSMTETAPVSARDQMVAEGA